MAVTACSARWVSSPLPEINIINDSEDESAIECTGWTGGVSHIISDSEDGYLTVEDFGGGDNYEGELRQQLVMK